MDRAGFQAWLDRYVEAWRSNDAEKIGALFTDDAMYSYGPFRDDDLHGRDAIVKSWLDDPDDPDTWEAHYEPFAVDDDHAVAVGYSRYFAAGQPHDTPEQEYGNVYLVQFAPDGRCRGFSEYYMETPDAAKRRIDRKVVDAVEAARAEWHLSTKLAADARELSETKVQG